jgi:hypothetical protein
VVPLAEPVVLQEPQEWLEGGLDLAAVLGPGSKGLGEDLAGDPELADHPP